jgi:sporulation protein YlmC with PRC-barrel domain
MKKAIYGMILAGAVLTWAQDAAQNPPPAAKQTSTNEAAVAAAEAEAKAPKISEMNKSTSIIGSAVANEKGETIGKVKDLVVDLERGEVGYVVIEMSAAQGEERNLPVPLRALKKGDDQKLVLNVSESVLAVSEGYKDSELPAADAFAVGGAAGSESGSGSSEETVSEEGPAQQPQSKEQK